MKIRVTMEFEVGEDKRYAAAAEIESTAAGMAAALKEAKLIRPASIVFPKGPKAKAKK